MEWNDPCEDGMVGPLQDVLCDLATSAVVMVDGILVRRHYGEASWLCFWRTGRPGEDGMGMVLQWKP